MKKTNKWVHECMSFVEVDGIVYVKVDDILKGTEEIRKGLKKETEVK